TLIVVDGDRLIAEMAQPTRLRADTDRTYFLQQLGHECCVVADQRAHNTGDEIRRAGTYHRVYLRERLSRTRIEMSIGVPTKPNSSRSRRSMNRRYDASRKPVVNSTNLGGRVPAWVPNRILGCLPPRIGCGWAATSWPRKVLRRPVGMRVSQPARAVSIAGTSRSACR